MTDHFLIANLLYSDLEDFCGADPYSSELRFVGLLLLVAAIACALAGFVVLRRQWRRSRLQDPRKDHYRCRK